MKDSPQFDPSPHVKPRLTVVTRLYHQQHGASPVGAEEQYYEWLSSDEQPFKRIVSIGKEWVSLSSLGCWLKECSLISLTNEEGRHLSHNPSLEEREETTARVVEVATEGPPLIIGHIVRPGRHTFFCPEKLEDVFIRCRQGKARITLWVFPA